MADDLVQLALAEANKAPPPLDDLLRELADALARKDAEIAELRKALNAAVEVSGDWDRGYDAAVERAEQAEARAERAEARVREAPVVVCRTVHVAEGHHRETSVFNLEQDRPHTSQSNGWIGKPVALVLLDTEEAK